jgi:hypothetical protein
LLRERGTPVGLVRFFGGTATARASVAGGALAGRGGRLLQGDGRANRFHGATTVDVKPSVTRWRVDAEGVVGARGMGRLLLLVAVRSIRRQSRKVRWQLWEDAHARIDDLERDLGELQARFGAEGGAPAFVHRALWDRDFDPRPAGWVGSW